MKKIKLLLLVISFTKLLTAQVQLTEGQQAVQQSVIKMFDALSNRDSVSLKEYCSVDILLLENGMVWNLDTLIQRGISQNQAADFKRINTIDFINTAVDKGTAWTTYKLHSEITRNGAKASVQWMETIVLAKEKEKWKIKVLHSTLIKRS